MIFAENQTDHSLLNSHIVHPTLLVVVIEFYNWFYAFASTTRP